MRAFPLLLLLMACSGMSACTPPTADAPPVNTLPPPARPSVSAGTATGGVPGPAADQRRVPLENVVGGDSAYAATLPVLQEAEGTIQLRVAVNPHAQTLEKISVLFTPHASGVTYRQLGEGVGRYDATTGRYYFLTGYQKVSKRADGRIKSGGFQEINGWIAPATNSGAVAHRSSP